MQDKNVAVAFVKGVHVAEGKIMLSAAQEWLESVAAFHTAHSTAAEACDPEELRAALSVALEAGMNSGVTVPRPKGG